MTFYRHVPVCWSVTRVWKTTDCRWKRFRVLLTCVINNEPCLLSKKTSKKSEGRFPFYKDTLLLFHFLGLFKHQSTLLKIKIVTECHCNCFHLPSLRVARRRLVLKSQLWLRYQKLLFDWINTLFQCCPRSLGHIFVGQLFCTQLFVLFSVLRLVLHHWTEMPLVFKSILKYSNCNIIPKYCHWKFYWPFCKRLYSRKGVNGGLSKLHCHYWHFCIA